MPTALVKRRPSACESSLTDQQLIVCGEIRHWSFIRGSFQTANNSHIESYKREPKKHEKANPRRR
ncbi:hypothetical protein [Tardiphaga sp. 862_B3_N1_1]|uniref:hypothetical protein n=1 Tax=Tardiphaga sp. 862_B3_N1_1 TaxID=3240763 RepID=UPI003F8C7393